MKKIVLSAFLAIGLLTMSGCLSATKDIKVVSKTSEKVNLDGYKTYAWLPISNIIIDEKDQFKGRGYSVNDYMQSKINKALLNADKTLNREDPDFVVSYIMGVDMDAIKEKLDKDGKEQFENVSEAALIVILIDTQTQKVIWAGSAEAELKQETSDEESKARIDYSIEKMFADF
jgi:hypothetical protein